MGQPGVDMSQSVEDVVEQLHRSRQALLELSEDVWQEIDPNDRKQREAGVEFVESLEEAIDDLENLSEDVEKLVRTYTKKYRDGVDVVGRPSGEPADDAHTRPLNGEDFTGTRPHRLRTDDFVVRGVDNWSNLLCQLLGYLADTHPDRFEALADADRFTSSRGNRYLSDDPADLRSPESFADGAVHAEMNLSANDIAERIADLLDFFDHDPDAAEVRVTE